VKSGEVVAHLERLIEAWKVCELTTDEFSVQLAHASRDFNRAVDEEERD
jgi:hypothetical protein